MCKLRNPINFCFTKQKEEEQWFPLDCYDIKDDVYEISNLGNIRRTEDLFPMKQRILESDYGFYRYVALETNNDENKKFLIHRLVGTKFIPNDDKDKNQINHIDNNGMNNYQYNVEWVTPKENTLNTYRDKLTNVEIYSIYNLIEEYRNNKDILDNCGLPLTDENYELINNIRMSHYNNQLPNYDYNNCKRNSAKFSNDTIHLVCKMICEGKNYIQIANELDIDLSNYNYKRSFNAFVNNIKNRKHYTHISQYYDW